MDAHNEEIALYLNNPESYAAGYEEFVKNLELPQDHVERLMDSFRNKMTQAGPESKTSADKPASDRQKPGIAGQLKALKRYVVKSGDASLLCANAKEAQGGSVLTRPEAADDSSFEAISSMISVKLKELASYEKFQTYLFELINTIGLDIPEVAVKMGLDKSYIYQILKGRRLPSRDKTIEMALLLQLSLEQANKLLNLAGYTLYTLNRRDIIIAFCLENKQSLVYANLYLNRFGEKPL